MSTALSYPYYYRHIIYNELMPIMCYDECSGEAWRTHERYTVVAHPNLNNTDFIKYCDKPIKTSMFVTPVGPEELQRFVSGLINNKSSGMDNIGPSLVKLVFPAICFPLLHIFNLSLSTGVVPSKLKIAKVIPVYKKGDIDLTCNYRPISLLSIFDRLLEKNYG